MNAVYQALDRQDRAALQDWRELNRLMRENADGFAAPDRLRGAVVGTLDEILGGLAGAMGDVSPRRLFTAALIGGSGSSKHLTEGQARILLNVLTVKDDESGDYEINHPNADKARGITAALARDGVTLPIAQEDAAMNQLPTNDTAPQAQETAPAPSVPEASELTPTQHSEAPISATARFQDQNGASWLFTMREGVTGEGMADFVGKLSKASDFLVKQGFAPTGDSYGSSTKSNGSLPSSGGSGSSDNGQQEGFGNGGTFDADELVAMSNGGRTYWKVKGGKFHKFGVTIWPEVMEECLKVDPGTLDVGKVYDMSGWTAQWEQDGDYKKIVAMSQ